MARLDAAPQIAAIVITGAGAAFAAGADIRELASLEGPEQVGGGPGGRAPKAQTAGGRGAAGRASSKPRGFPARRRRCAFELACLRALPHARARAAP